MGRLFNGTVTDNLQNKEIENLKKEDNVVEKRIDELKADLDKEETFNNEYINAFVGKSGSVGYIYFATTKVTLTQGTQYNLGKIPEEFKPKHAIYLTEYTFNGRNYQIAIDVTGEVLIKPLSVMVANAALNGYVFFKI